MKKMVRRVFIVIVSVGAILLGAAFYAGAQTAALRGKVKSYDGTITQINMGDGSFVLRMRDGSLVTVANPLKSDLFINVKGVLDPSGKAMDGVTSISLKDPNGPDIMPFINGMLPASGQVGTKIMLTGAGFTKKNNAVSVGDVQYAVTGIPSKDGRTLTFTLPSSPCNQKTKANCAPNVLAQGTYSITVTNENGVSNNMPFQLFPLPPLAVTTDLLPQGATGVRYKMTVDAIGGISSYVWRISDGQLPGGLSLVQAACTDTPCRASAVILGAPTTPGTFQFTVTISSGSETISRQFSITVVQSINAPMYY